MDEKKETCRCECGCKVDWNVSIYSGLCHYCTVGSCGDDKLEEGDDIYAD